MILHRFSSKDRFTKLTLIFENGQVLTTNVIQSKCKQKYKTRNKFITHLLKFGFVKLPLANEIVDTLQFHATSENTKPQLTTPISYEMSTFVSKPRQETFFHL